VALPRKIVQLLVVGLLALMLAVATTPALVRAQSDSVCSTGNAEQYMSVDISTSDALQHCEGTPNIVEGKGKERYDQGGLTFRE
jgi:hypothetical protein